MGPIPPRVEKKSTPTYTHNAIKVPSEYPHTPQYTILKGVAPENYVFFTIYDITLVK